MSLKPRNVDFDETWQGLKKTVYGVVTLGDVKRSTWNSCFSDVYSLCVAYPEPLAETLYSETKSLLQQHVDSLLDLVSQGDGEDDSLCPPGEGLLYRYHKYWKQYSQGVEILNFLYQYLNQQHIKKQKMSDADIIYGNTSGVCLLDRLEMGELGLLSWERGLVKPLKQRLVKRLLAGLQASREGRPHRPDIIRDVINSFVEMQAYRKKDNLSLYTELAETPYLEATGEHCQHFAAGLLQKCTVSEYMTEVLEGLEDEMARGTQFLHGSSISKLRSVYEKHMVADHLSFLHAECQTMVEREHAIDLKNAYILLRGIPSGMRPVLDIMLNHIKNQGMQAIGELKGEQAHNQFVEQMLDIHNKYKTLFSRVLDSDQAFIGVLDKACSAVINSKQNDQPCRSPELLARYCDGLLRKSTRGVSESEAEEKLASSIIIFKYIDDKDVFQKYYARLMAKRLIHQQSYSMEQEEAMINRLKQACGYEFTNKLLRMYTDINISGDLNSKFLEFLKSENADAGMGFSINVLQAGAWPLSATQSGGPVALPPQLEKPIQLFEKFYHNSYSGRKLAWLHHLCMGELKLCYTKKPYYVTMQTVQMSVMLEFERGDSYSVQELVKATRQTSDILVKHLTALSDSKLIVIKGNLEDPLCGIALNLEFTSKRTKLRVVGGGGATGTTKEQAEADRTAVSVDEDRKMYLQAAIVRIMKARKVLRHNDLIQEVFKLSSAFAPNIAMIKKCIESLIDKQYIERTPGVSDEYSYVA